MRTIFFISDAHLGSGENSDKQTEKELLDFFHYVKRQADELYIVGDLFDFWFEYRSVVPRHYFNILSALKSLVANGINIGFITGNHDFWVDDFFRKDLGICIYKNPLKLEIDGHMLYLAHGDGLAKKDTGYRLLKRVLRHPLNIRLYRLLHPDIAFRLAHFFSRTSRNYKELKDVDEEYIQYARSLFHEGFDFVILAHTHRPQIYREGKQTYINTGDWLNHFTYAKLEKGHLSLEYWKKDIQ
jgi:UDP-2,3-diacylglucosamine hydrolase